MGAQTGGHSLPGRESTAGSQCMDFDSFLSTHNIQRSDGSGAGRNICDVAGLTEGANISVIVINKCSQKKIKLNFNHEIR